MEHRFFRRQTNILPFKFSRTLPKIHVSPKCLTRFYVFKKLHRYYEVFADGKLIFFTKRRRDFSRKKTKDGTRKLFFTFSNLNWNLQKPPKGPRAVLVLFFAVMWSLSVGQEKRIEGFSMGGDIQKSEKFHKSLR